MGELRPGRDSDRAPADLVDHPISILEAAGSLPCSPPSIVASTVAEPVGRVDRSAPPPHISSSRPTRWPCSWLAIDRGTGVVLWNTLGHGWQPSSRTCRRPGPIGRSSLAARCRIAGGTCSRKHWTARWMGQVQRPVLGGGFRGLPQVLLPNIFTELHSTKQIEDCIAWGSR